MQFIGSILVLPEVLYGFISFIALWALISGFFAFRGVRQLLGALATAVACINQKRDSAAFAESYENTNQELAGINIVGRRWREFRTTFVIPTVANRPIRATEPADHWFNATALTGSVLNQRYHASLPGLLVGAGLLFTFLGLAAALGTAGGIVAEGADQHERNLALKTLLDTASFKFLTSIAGLLASILYTIFWKAYCQTQIGNALDGFLVLLEERVPLLTATATQDEANGILRRQLTQMETFSNDLAVSIGTALDGALDQRLGDHIGPLARAMEQLKDSLATQNQDAVVGMLDEFLKKLNSNTGDSMKEAAQGLATLGQDLASLKDTLNSAATRMTEAAVRMSGSMGEGAEQALSRVTGQFEKMIEQLRALSADSRQTGASAFNELAACRTYGPRRFMLESQRRSASSPDAANEQLPPHRSPNRLPDAAVYR